MRVLKQERAHNEMRAQGRLGWNCVSRDSDKDSRPQSRTGAAPADGPATGGRASTAHFDTNEVTSLQAVTLSREMSPVAVQTGNDVADEERSCRRYAIALSLAAVRGGFLSILLYARCAAVYWHVHIHGSCGVRCRNMSRGCSISRLSTGR
jgi:hypothetical protein